MEHISFGSAKVGDQLPDVALATFSGTQIVTHRTGILFAQGKSVIVGVIGAFTPVCTNDHVSEFVRRAGDLAQKGFSRLYCIAPNDPWTVSAWAKIVDPRQRLYFLSDGNLEFARALGLCGPQDRGMFVGERNARYLMLVEDGVIKRVSIDPDPFSMTCTGAETLNAAI